MSEAWPLLDAFSYPFMQRALLAMVVLALASGVVGFVISLRDLEFVTDGLVHAVFPGLVIGFAVSGPAGLLPGAFIAGLLAALLLTLFARSRWVSQDAAIAVLLTSAFSLGVVLVSTQENYVTQLEALFFGSLLTVGEDQLLQMALVAALAVVLVVLTWRRQLFRAFDPGGFAAAGHRLFRTDLVLNVAIAMLVVAGVQAIGNLLVLSLLIVPMATARLISRRMLTLVPIAIAVPLLASIAGLWLSFETSVSFGSTASPGAVVVLCMLVLYVTALTVSGVTRRLAGWLGRGQR